MNRSQLEKLYEGQRPEGLQIKKYGWSTVEGYTGLDDVNKLLYEKFIINLFNGFGLDSRMTMIPKGIYYVEDFDYLVKENPEDDYFT